MVIDPTEGLRLTLGSKVVKVAPEKAMLPTLARTVETRMVNR